MMKNLKFLELPLEFLYLCIVQVIILKNTECEFQGFKFKLWLQ